MKALIFALIAGFAIATVHAQSDRKLIFWNGDKACGYRNKAFTERDTAVCDTVQTERGPVSTITHNGIALAVAFLEDDKYSIVAAQINNSTDEVISFDSDLWGAAHFKTKAGFYAREMPILAETAIPTRDMIRNMSTNVRLESTLGTFIADGQKTSESKEVRRSDGTRYRVDVIVPDKEAQQAAVRQSAARTELNTNEQRRIRETALTAKSVLAGCTVKGLVYFRRVKKADFVVFSLSVGETTFVFQLPRVKDL